MSEAHGTGMGGAAGGILPVAGWYADPWGVAPLRWWDGAQWTGYAGGAPVAGVNPYAARPPRPLLPASTPTSTVWVWLVVLLPLASLLLLPFVRPHVTLRASSSGTLLAPDPLALVGGPAFVILQLVSLAATAAVIVAAWRDQGALTARGVERPFHWAWTFLGPLVYVIGRTVVVRKVAPRSSVAPLVLVIVVAVIAAVGTVAWTIAAYAGLLDTAFDPTLVGA